MTFDPHRNLAASLVATAPSPAASGTSMVLDSLTSALFPDPASVGAYNVVVHPPGVAQTADNTEIVRFTAKSTHTFTITRAQESTAARAIAVGDVVEMAITAKSLTDIEAVGAAAGPAFRAYRNGTQAITTATWTKVQLNAESFDTDNLFDSTTNYRFTPTTAGYYLITGTVHLVDLADGKLATAAIYKNGAAVAYNKAETGSVNTFGVVVCDLISFNGSTDYVELWINHNHGSDRDVASTSALTYFSGVWQRS